MFGSAHRLLPPSWRRRSGFLLFVLLGFFALLVARVLQLTVVEGEEHRLRAQQNTVIKESVPAPRGHIYDRKGRLIVSNHPVYDLYVVPAEMESLHHNLVELAALANEEPAKLKKRLVKAHGEAPLEDLVVKRSLSKESLVEASKLAEQNKGVYLGFRGERRYSYGKAASHILGYMGVISNQELRNLRHLGFSARDFVGQTGLERYYDRELRGQKGIRHRWVDAGGRTLKTELVQAPVQGNNVYLNIDMQLQLATEKALSKSLQGLAYKNGERSAAAAVVFGVDSGEVLALASLPNYDPRPFARGVAQKEYSALLNDRNTPLVNRATHASFSPGSTYKMITGMAALELGLTQANSHLFCGGSYKGASCFVRSGHGSLVFTEALAHSCSAVFYMFGDRMGIDNLARFSRAAGLGSKTGIDLPGEDPGLYPDPAWKLRVWEEPWYGGDTINSSIGQGFVLATPLQMARATAAVANGGKVYRPRLVDRLTTYAGQHTYQNSKEKMSELPVEDRHLEAVRKGMRGAVTHGTSTVVNSSVVKVAGKTGTVESFPNPFNPKGRNRTWFVCFAPYENPEIAITVFFQQSGGYGGSVAAPVAREILDEYFGAEKK